MWDKICPAVKSVNSVADLQKIIFLENLDVLLVFTC